MTAPVSETPWIGVIIVSYRAADFIAECLESLMGTEYPRLKVMVVENDSPDGSAAAIRDWALGDAPFAHPADWPVPAATVSPKPRPFAEFGGAEAARASFDALGEITLIHSGSNLGYAGGVNVGLEALLPHPEIELFWVLNPDCVVEPGTPAAFAAAARKAGGRFALMGGRASFFGEPEIVQADGGRFRPWLGRGGSVNKNRRADSCDPPAGESLDYIHGMCMVASRAFIQQAGLMDASWFLYYEEVDWAYRRGNLPLLVVPEARIRHRSGASSGDREAGLGSLFSVYVFSRNGLRFMARWYPWRIPFAYLSWLAISIRNFALRGAWRHFWAAMRGLHGLSPPDTVRRSASPEVWETLDRRSRS